MTEAKKDDDFADVEQAARYARERLHAERCSLDVLNSADLGASYVRALNSRNEGGVPDTGFVYGTPPSDLKWTFTGASMPIGLSRYDRFRAFLHRNERRIDIVMRITNVIGIVLAIIAIIIAIGGNQ
jgi:hypothetical protein